MSEEFEVSLKTVCCTCLNTDRKMQKLCRISEGVNLLYLLLSYDPDAYKEIFYKDSTSLHVCWECGAIMRKIRVFQVQSSRAIREFNNVCNSSGKHIKPLSNLSTHILANDTIIQDPTEYFIDCGPYIKAELDPDDIPLSQLNNYENHTLKTTKHKQQINKTIKANENVSKDENDVSDNPNSLLRDSKQAHRTKNKPLDLKYNKKANESVSDDDNDVPDNLNSPIRDYTKAHSPIESYKKAHRRKNKPLDLKHNEKANTNVSEDENDIPDNPNSPIRDCKKANSPIESYKQAHKTITKQLKNYKKANEVVSDDENDIPENPNSSKSDFKKVYKTISKPKNLKKYKNNPDSLTKCYKKKMYNFSGNKKKRKKNVFSEVKLKYPCPECNICFDNKNTRWKHVQKVHRDGHQCSVCEKRFALKSNLQRHEKIHSSPPPRQTCETCSKSVRVDLMQAHNLTHTDRQRYSCLSCDKTFVCRDTYHSHLKYSRAHCQEDVLARYACSTCDKRYRSQAELKDHINYQHKGLTEHKCPICEKGLATKRCIRRHVRRAHEGIKENARDKICQRCGKAFRDKKSLREHEYIHTGERPLSCELCGQTFRQYASLYSHRKRVHKLIVPQKSVTVLNKE